MKINDYTSRDFDSIKDDLIKRLQVIAPELTNTNESEFHIAIIDLFCYVGDLLSYSIDMHAIETYLATARQRKNVIKSCNLINYKLDNSKPSKVELTFSIANQLLTDVIIPAKTLVYTDGDNSIKFETDNICIISAGQTENKVFATQGVTEYEVLGYSNGEKDQIFTINKVNVVDGIEVYSGDMQYFEVNSFVGSNFDDVHFITNNVEVNKIEIKFGNGLNAKIPTENSRVMVIYRICNGRDGNVGANTIKNIKGQIFDSNNSLVEVTLTNENESYGGADIESIESAKLHAPAQQYTLWRAVTEEDFKQLALTQKDVEQANAIQDKINKIVRVYIKLEDTDTIPENRLTELIEFFEERSLMGADFSINPPEFITANIAVDVKLFPTYSNYELKEFIENLINTDTDINNLNFGELPVTGLIIKKIMELKQVMNAQISMDITSIEPYQIAKINVLLLNVFGGV